jgi:hypothetical protein
MTAPKQGDLKGRMVAYSTLLTKLATLQALYNTHLLLCSPIWNHANLEALPTSSSGSCLDKTRILHPPKSPGP